MLEEIFIMCFYGIIYLKIEGGEKRKKIFLDFVFENFLKKFFEVRLCRSISLDYSTSFILLLL